MMQYVKALKNILVLLLFALSIEANAQTSAMPRIPVIDLSFFKGPVPKSAAFASTTYLDYHYDFNIESSRRSSAVKVTLSMHVEPNSAKSYLDRSRVPEDRLDALIRHEQGHVILGYIIAKKVEDALNASSYTKNYKAEIRNNYQKFYARYEKLQISYDEETRHGMNNDAQQKWDEIIRQLANASWKK